MLIKSQVVQRAGAGADNADEAAAPEQAAPGPASAREWRSECRRLIGEVLDERRER